MENRKKKTKVETLTVTAVASKRVGTRGKTFEGVVTKKFPKRVVIEFERNGVGKSSGKSNQRQKFMQDCQQIWKKKLMWEI